MPPRVDENRCTGCGKCEEVCPARVYRIIDRLSKVEGAEECTECGACMDECPSKAIELK
ncbi:MAG: 4Fe-4S binding protein [Methanomassiliicoccales archaeon]